MSSRPRLIPRLAQFLVNIWPQQYSFIAAQRMQRAVQVYSFYTRIYSERTANATFQRFVHQLRQRVHYLRGQLQPNRKPLHRPFSFVLSAASVFFWDKEGITKQELNETVDEFWRVLRSSGAGKNGMPRGPNEPRVNGSSSSNGRLSDEMAEDSGDDDGDEWEPIIVKERFQVWRKPVPDTYLYQYKIFGSYDDIPARAFFSVQMDTEYRKTWDKLVIKLEVVDKEDRKAVKDVTGNEQFDSRNEVVHWVMHYPFPLYSRDYCYIRRGVIDAQNNLMVMVSRATEHPKCPQMNSHVRVHTYESKMVIRPHKTFDELGFDYLLTYFDDPKAAFPSMAYNWMACSGVPEFVEQLHRAAYQLTIINKNLAAKAAKSTPQTTSTSSGTTSTSSGTTSTTTTNSPSSSSNSNANSTNQASNMNYVYA